MPWGLEPDTIWVRLGPPPLRKHREYGRSIEVYQHPPPRPPPPKPKKPSRVPVLQGHTKRGKIEVDTARRARRNQLAPEPVGDHQAADTTAYV